MADKITKINKLRNIESFMQVNLFKGYTFIDKAGEIINHFYRNQDPPIVPEISPNGMVILRPDDITEELKVSPSAIWAHYLNPSSLDQVATFYSKNLIDIARILNVNKVTRVGWRNYFVYEYNNPKDREQSLRKLSVQEDMKVELAVYSITLSRVTITLSISKLSKKDQKQTPAVLIDIDAYIAYEKPNEITEAERDIAEIRRTIQSSELMDKINALIK